MSTAASPLTSVRLRTRTTSDQLERALVVIAFAIGIGALLSMFRLPDPQGDPWAGSAEDPLTRGIWLLLYLAALFFVLPHWRELIGLMRGNVWIPALLLLVLLSAIWSPDPALTLRRALAINLAAGYGYYLAVRFTLRQVLSLLGIALGLALVLSIVFIVLMPGYGIYGDIFRGSTWRGVFLHKQPLGRAAALGVGLFLVLAYSRIRPRVSTALAALAAVLVWGSSSSTAVLAAVAVLALLLLIAIHKHLGPHGTIGVLATAISLAVGCLLFVGGVTASETRDTTLSALGKDSTLTDRTTVWEEVEPAIAAKPLLGYGVSGFWRGWQGESSVVWRHIDWEPVHAHNGYLDLTLDLGFIGLFIFVLGLLTVLRQALVTRQPSLARLWALLFVLFLLIQSTAESVLLRPNSAYWILYVFTAALLTKGALGAPRPRSVHTH
jgi:O-antigen ligase